MKKAVSLGLVLLLTTGLFAGCASNSKTNKGSTDLATKKEKVELKFLGWGGVDEKKLVDDIIAKYEAENPNVDIQFENPADYWPKLQTMIAGGQAPDLFYMGFPEFKEYEKQKVLLNLDGKFGDLSDFYEGGIKAFTGADGKLYGLPKDWGTYVFYYNKKIFKDAGVKSPAEYVAENNWTMDNMLKAAKEIKGKAGSQFGVVVEPNRWKAFVGANWVDANGKVNVTTDQFANDLQFVADLWLKEKVAPNVQELKSLSAADRFMQGNTAMFMSGRWMALQFASVKDLQWDIVPMPVANQRNNDKFTWMDSVGLVASKTTKYPDEVVKFMKFYTDTWAQSEMAKRGLAIPVRKSVAKSDSFVKGLQGVNNEAHTTYPAQTLTVFDKWSAGWKELDNAFIDVFNGTTSAKDAAKKAQQAIDALK